MKPETWKMFPYNTTANRRSFSNVLFEQFDQPFTRETVAELLMGLYDSQLSDAKLNRIKLEGCIDELKQSIKITGQFLDNPVKQSPAFLQQQIETLKQEINTISDEVRQLRNAEVIYGFMVSKPNQPVEPTINSKLSTDSTRIYGEPVEPTLNSKLNNDYQVIFATSNIANELNKPEYTVGDYYSQANKSLKNV